MAHKNGMAGRRSGKLTVIGDSGQRRGTYPLGLPLRLRYELESGNAAGCGMS